MAIIKGQKEYERFKTGERLSYKQSILAQCYVCNGMNEGGEDCKGVSCSLYQYMPHRAGQKKRQITEPERQRLAEQLKKARKPLKLPLQDAEIL